MNNKFFIITIFLLIITFSAIGTANAQLKGGESFAESLSTAVGISTAGDVVTTIGFMIAGLLGFVGAIFLILIIYGGILWMTAGGNEEQIKKARKYIINATIGLVIVVLANLITTFIFRLFID